MSYLSRRMREEGFWDRRPKRGRVKFAVTADVSQARRLLGEVLRELHQPMRYTGRGA